ncbi:LysM peptidoglycan-binding domain-containing protein [Micromonospora sp. R77]|nr:LysM peptidoglycan-binding domain-containing protein [Micromonospora sp. R77]MCI4063645.1 LysM peptidoglycan-binding domain-containing protein [Micromonospora sp. R77]
MAAPQRSAVRRTGQVLTGLGALVVLCGVLAGAPIALLAFAGNPLPDHLPTLAEVGTALTSRDDGQLFLRALAVVGWFGWATFAFSVVVELVAQVLRRPAPKLPGMGRQQRAAAALVGSVALILAASPAAASAATLAAPTPAVAMAAPTSAGTLNPSTSAVTLAVSNPVAGSGVGASVRSAPVATPEAAPPLYRVAKGDYLGEVAERYLDDFDRYGEVARLNRLADPNRIRPGQLLKLPESASDAGPARTPPAGWWCGRRGRPRTAYAQPGRAERGAQWSGAAPHGPGAQPGDAGGAGATGQAPKGKPSPGPG